MIDGMFQTGTDQVLDDQLQRAPAFKADDPKGGVGQFLWQGTAKPVAGMVANRLAFGAEIIGAFGDVAGAGGFNQGGIFSTPTAKEKQEQDAAAKNLREQGPGFSSEAGDMFRARAKELMPDPQTTHASTQVMAALVEFGGAAVGYALTTGPAAPLLLGADMGMAEADKLKQQGVDLATRTKVGAVAGVVAGASVALPIAGRTIAQTAGLVAVGGPGGFIAQNAASKAILEANDYSKQASQYDPLDPVGLALSTIVPAGFGAVAMRGARTAPKASDPRGVRNNNPGNIEAGKTTWQGQVGSDGRFATFETPEAGIRALGVNLLTYQEKHGLKTVEGIINRWAPPGENNTGAYVNAVAKELGVGPKDQINLRDPAVLEKLTGAIVRHENGKQPYTAAMLREGVEMAITGKSVSREARAAIARDPDLVAAARVRQTLNTIDSYRLTSDADITGMTRHQDAMESAHAQLARGEPVSVSDLLQPTERVVEVSPVGAIEAAPRLGAEPVSMEPRVLTPEVRAATDLIDAIDRGGVPLNPARVNYIARDMGMEVSRSAPVEQTIQRIREAVARAAEPTEAPAVRAADRPAALVEAMVKAFEPPRPPRAAAQAKPIDTPARATGRQMYEAAGESGPSAPTNKAVAAGEGAPSAAAKDPGPALDRAASEAVELNPDLMVQLEGMDKPMRAADLLEQVKKEAADETRDSSLVDVAANCFIRT
jgi:hypothetical protein